MNKMRELTSVILYTLVLAFIGTIIFNWGMNYTGKSTNPTVIGKVNGVEIDAKQFDLAYNQQLDQYRKQAGGDISDNQVTFIRNQVWESMIRDALVKEEIAQDDIQVADAEITFRLFEAPPEVLKSNPSFMNEQKQFDMAKYQAAINDPNLAAQWKPIEDYLRDNLPFQKFQQHLMATVRLTEDEIRREYLSNTQNARVRYIFVDPNRFEASNFSITDAMIRDYYNAHKEDYRQAEQRSIEYVLLPTTPTSKDSSDVRAEAQRVLQRARSGEDFSELAITYSEDPGSREKGGDLGYFSKGAMVKPFEDAAFSAHIGDIVGPVQSPFGLHIIKVVDKRLSKKGAKGKRQEEVKASHILLKFAASRKTLDRVRDNADYLAEQAKDEPLDEAAKEVEGSVRKSGLFVKGQGFIPGIGVNSKISDFVFRSNKGAVGPVEETDKGLIVFKVAEIKPERTKDLDEVSTLIRNKLVAEAQMRKAGELAAKIHQAIEDGADFEAAAKADSVEVQLTEPFKRTGFVSGIGRDAAVIGAAFSLEKVGDVSKPVEGTRGYYLLKLVEKDAFDEKDYQAKRAQTLATLKQQKQNQAFSNWYAAAKEKANIKDYRSRFYN